MGVEMFNERIPGRAQWAKATECGKSDSTSRCRSLQWLSPPKLPLKAITDFTVMPLLRRSNGWEVQAQDPTFQGSPRCWLAHLAAGIPETAGLERRAPRSARSRESQQAEQALRESSDGTGGRCLGMG